MLIVNDHHRLLAGVVSLNEPCLYYSQPLKAYPLILSDDAAQTVYYPASRRGQLVEGAIAGDDQGLGRWYPVESVHIEGAGVALLQEGTQPFSPILPMRASAGPP